MSLSKKCWWWKGPAVPQNTLSNLLEPTCTFFTKTRHCLSTIMCLPKRGSLSQVFCLLRVIAMSLQDFATLRSCCYRPSCHRRVKWKGYSFKVIITNERGNGPGIWHLKKEKKTTHTHTKQTNLWALQWGMEPTVIWNFACESSISRLWFPAWTCSIHFIFSPMIQTDALEQCDHKLSTWLRPVH